MSELEFKKTGKGLTIKDKTTGKPFGAIVPKANVDKLGNKFELRVAAGVPKSIREELHKERKEKKQITAGQAKLSELSLIHIIEMHFTTYIIHQSFLFLKIKVKLVKFIQRPCQMQKKWH